MEQINPCPGMHLGLNTIKDAHQIQIVHPAYPALHRVAWLYSIYTRNPSDIIQSIHIISNYQAIKVQLRVLITLQ